VVKYFYVYIRYDCLISLLLDDNNNNEEVNKKKMNVLEAQIKKIEDDITETKAKEAKWEKAWEKAENEGNTEEDRLFHRNQYATASQTLASLQKEKVILLERQERELKKAEGNFLFFFFALYFSLFLSLVFLFSSSRLPWFLCLSAC